jgi:amino-acid N-acetyltransferase
VPAVPAVADLQIRVATANDIGAIAALLASAGLPALDTGAFRGEDFRVALRDGTVIGAIGLEQYGNAALLRSLVIAPHARGHGAGAALVGALEAHARMLGLQSLVLLTTTADVFFQRRGYAVIARDAMPSAVQCSSEFATLCPASAVCMRKLLASAQHAGAAA